MYLEKAHYDFISEAKSFCRFLEELNKFEINKCHQIIINLTELYSKAMSLKIPEGSTDFDIHIDVDKVFVDFGKYNTYSEVYDPYNDKEVVCGSLQDDFSDIYKELKIGLKLYNKGLKSEAYYQMWWSFNFHWCYHAVDALRALNAIYTDVCSKIE